MVMTTYSMFYTGTKAHLIKRGDGDFVMQPNERKLIRYRLLDKNYKNGAIICLILLFITNVGETLTMTVPPEEYMAKTVEHCQFSNRFLATVLETGQTWVAEDDFSLEKPNLSIRIHPELGPKVGRLCKILMSFVNPLKEDLTGCYFTIECPGVITSTKRRFR